MRSTQELVATERETLPRRELVTVHFVAPAQSVLSANKRWKTQWYVCSLMIESIASPACVPSTCYVMPCIVTL